jgi:hypothetical protein
VTDCQNHKPVQVTGGRLCLSCLKFYADFERLKPSYRTPSKDNPDELLQVQTADAHRQPGR